ncbi:MAG: tetratricopeptide repeat protein [Alphaproteobacteria bacterium]|nr:tetratricopeptide repeat protein [Alphaproteobacteria bacterium]
MVRFSTLGLCVVLSLSLLSLSGCESLKQKQQTSSAEELKFKVDKKQGPNVKTLEQTMEENAKAAFDASEYRKAAELYAQLVIGRDTNTKYRLAYADSLRLLGETPKAHQQYQDVLSADENSIDALEGNGLTYMVEGKFQDAVTIFKKVMEKDALRWRTINALGVCLTMTNRYDEAIPYFQTALEVSPNNPAILNNKALAYALSDKNEEAIKTLENASQSLSVADPKRKTIDLNLALFYSLAGKLDDAERIARLHLKDAELANNMGLYASLAQDPKLAKSYINQALAQSPSYYQKAWDNLQILESKHSLASDD